METPADRLRQLIQPAPARSAAEKLRQALALADAGVAMMRLNLRRRFPTETEAQIEQRLRAWLGQRSGATHGDGAGRPSSRRFDG